MTSNFNNFFFFLNALVGLNKMLCDIMLQENNQLWAGKSNSIISSHIIPPGHSLFFKGFIPYLTFDLIHFICDLTI